MSKMGQQIIRDADEQALDNAADLAWLATENGRLTAEVGHLEAEVERLRVEYGRREIENHHLGADAARLRDRVAKARALLGEGAPVRGLMQAAGRCADAGLDRECRNLQEIADSVRGALLVLLDD